MEPKERILLIDDNKTDVKIVRKMLSDDYQLLIAGDGQRGLEMMKEKLPELVLLDIMMPQMDGYEVCRRIRVDKDLCHIKVIMVSGLTSSGERLEGYEAGADGFVIKPFAKGELLAQVRAFIRLKSTEEIEQLKSNILNLISHEVRTPLTNIISPARMLMDGTYIDEKKRDMMAAGIYMNAKRLNRLFEKMFMLVEMRCGRWDFQFDQIDLCDIVDDAVNLATKETQSREVSLTTDYVDRPKVWADPKMIKMVISSILDNAVKFSQANPCIDIEVEVTGSATDAFVSITDHGKGVSPEFLHRVFEEFTVDDMAHHSTGHGLSMAIAAQIAQWHNGMIGANSNGAKTTFVLRLPVAEDAELQQAEACAVVMAS